MRIRIENTTARIKHLALGGGRTLTVPPLEGKRGVVVELTEAEADNYERTLSTPLVQKWIAKGELIVTALATDASAGGEGDEGDEEPAPSGKKGKKAKGKQAPSDAGNGSSAGGEGSNS